MAQDRPQPYPSIEAVASALGMSSDRLVGGMNLPQTAHRLGCSPSKLRQLALDGHINHIRFGRSWRFHWQHIGEFLSANENKPRPSIANAHDRRARVSAVRGTPTTDLEDEARAFGLLARDTP